MTSKHDGSVPKGWPFGTLKWLLMSRIENTAVRRTRLSLQPLQGDPGNLSQERVAPRMRSKYDSICSARVH